MARLDAWTYPERLILAAASGFPSKFRLARPKNLSGAGRYPLIVRPLLEHQLVRSMEYHDVMERLYADLTTYTVPLGQCVWAILSNRKQRKNPAANHCS